jgi:acyl-CoA dehydrogenase
MSTDTQFFQDMAERLFLDMGQQPVIEAAERGEFPLALWNAITEAGIPLALVAESDGGVGASIAEAVMIARAAGRHAAPGPLVETLLANRLLAQTGAAAVEGPLALVFAGTCHALPQQLFKAAWARQAQAIIVVGVSSGGAWVAVTRPGDWDLVDTNDAAGEPRFNLSLAPGANAAMHGLPTPGHYDDAFRIAALLRSGQMLGALEWCMERTVEYASERKQFGREIGKFQIVQQLLAEMASGGLAARAMVEAAVRAGPGQAGLPLLASARSRLGDAIDTTVAVAHQVHGAIGFSYEYGLNFRSRRLLSWRDEFGSVPYWRRQLAQHFLEQGADGVWPALTGLDDASLLKKEIA